MSLPTKQRQTPGHKYQTCGCQGAGEEMDWKVAVSGQKPLYREQVDNKALLYSTENDIQYPMTHHNGKKYQKITYMYKRITLLYSRT